MKSSKLSRRTFLKQTLWGVTAISLVPWADLWAEERKTVSQWAPEARLYTFHLIGHGHIDPVWLWSWREGLSVVMSTFRAALERMEENPEFKFTASSSLFYRWVAENDPVLFRQIRRRIDEGRWEVVGGWWVEPDVNLPCGEALVRQGLYGQRELERLVGRRARTAFLPDSFGHSQCLPQILRQQGMHRYVFMRPMDHEKKLPADLFWWEGPDSSRLLAYRIQIGYSNSRDMRERLERILREFGQQPTHTLMAFYGAGDHGGGPVKKNFQQIAEIRQQPGAPTLIYSTPDRYFDTIEQDPTLTLPVVQGNLHNHAVGCYSVESAIKKGNRQTETALIQAETIATLGSTCWGAHYPQEALTEAWHKLLFLQFHDSLAGSSQAEHSDVAHQGYGYAQEVADQCRSFALQKLEWQIATEDPESEYLIVFNPHAWEVRCDGEYDLNIQEKARPLDDRGQSLPYQWSVGSSQSESVKKLLFRTTLPPMGYRQIRVIKESTPTQPETDLQISERRLENRYLIVTFSDQGEIGIWDKETGQHVFLGGQTGNRALVLHDPGDTWGHGIQRYDESIGTFGSARFKILEQGPLRGMIRVISTYEASTLTIDWMLYAETRAVEARICLDWHEKQKILQFAFPVALENPTATLEAPFAYVEVERQGNEEPGHRWADVSGTCGTQPYGLAVINDAKYAYSIHDTELRLTIVRSPVYAHNAPNKLDPAREYPWMDQGEQTFRLRIVPHPGDWRQADLPRQADLLLAPPIVTYQGIHDGSLPKQGSFLHVKGSGIRIAALKQAETNEEWILRCVESFGRRTVAEIDFPTFQRTWQGVFAPFEIKTLRVNPKNGRIRTVNLLEE